MSPFRRPGSKPQLSSKIKYAWAASVTALVSTMMVMQASGQGSVYLPLINQLIDTLQQQDCSPRARQIPAATGTFNSPAGEKVGPATDDTVP